MDYYFLLLLDVYQDRMSEMSLLSDKILSTYLIKGSIRYQVFTGHCGRKQNHINLSGQVQSSKGHCILVDNYNQMCEAGNY